MKMMENRQEALLKNAEMQIQQLIEEKEKALYQHNSPNQHLFDENRKQAAKIKEQRQQLKQQEIRLQWLDEDAKQREQLAHQEDI